MTHSNHLPYLPENYAEILTTCAQASANAEAAAWEAFGAVDCEQALQAHGEALHYQIAVRELKQMLPGNTDYRLITEINRHLIEIVESTHAASAALLAHWLPF